MYKYKITFDVNIDYEEKFDYDSDCQNLKISYVDDDEFLKFFNSNKDVKEYEDSYNDYVKNENDKVKLLNIYVNEVYFDDYAETINGEIIVETEIPINNEKQFAEDLVDYICENNQLGVDYHVTGESWEDDWDYMHGEYTQTQIPVDYEETEKIYIHGENIKIDKID